MSDDGATPVLWWIQRERALYSKAKWSPEKDDEITRAGFAEWERWLSQYLHRAKVLGLDTDVGRQALAKYVTTAVAFLDSVHRLYGPLPAPGVPSGEIREWTL